MKKSLTYNEIKKFDVLATEYLVNNGYYIKQKKDSDGNITNGKFTDKENTKLTANIRNIIKQFNKHFELYQELKDDILRDNCSVDDKTKIILRDEKGGYKFTVEQEKNIIRQTKELDKQQVDVNVRITDGEWILSEDEIEIFNGIVIPEVEKVETEN